jgi:hypothetical protein
MRKEYLPCVSITPPRAQTLIMGCAINMIMGPVINVLHLFSPSHAKTKPLRIGEFLLHLFLTERRVTTEYTSAFET